MIPEKLSPNAIHSEIIAQYRKISTESFTVSPEGRNVLSFHEDNLKMHTLPHIFTQNGISDLNTTFEAFKREQRTDHDNKLHITVMSQVNARIRQDISTNRSIELLETRIGKMETFMGIMSEQMKL